MGSLGAGAWLLGGALSVRRYARELPRLRGTWGGRSTPVPEPNGEGMSARGIYAWVRHPMYTSVVIAALGVAAARGASAAWVLAVVLGAFL